MDGHWKSTVGGVFTIWTSDQSSVGARTAFETRRGLSTWVHWIQANPCETDYHGGNLDFIPHMPASVCPIDDRARYRVRGPSDGAGGRQCRRPRGARTGSGRR